MKVIAEYPVTKTIIVEIPDEIAKRYQKAKEEDNQDEMDWQYDRIGEYVSDVIKEKEGISYLDWADWDWEEDD